MTASKLIRSSILMTSLVAAPAASQVVAAPSRMALRPTLISLDQPAAVIGVATSMGTGARDTLGLLVTSVTRTGPAEKAGIEEGSRISSINGVSLRLSAADLGDVEMERLMNRRLTRELDKVRPGDEVDLRVYSAGQTRAVKVRTVAPESLYATRVPTVRRSADERASLGISISATGSRRDTLGVFVMAVDDAGPGAKAGLEEGQRIASINGVDLRVPREDAGDAMVSGTRLTRLERELAKVRPGDPVELRVYANGQVRNVRVTTVAASALRSDRMVRVIGSGGTTVLSPSVVDVDGELIATTVRRAIERAQGVRGELGEMLSGIERGLHGRTIRW